MLAHPRLARSTKIQKEPDTMKYILTAVFETKNEDDAIFAL